METINWGEVDRVIRVEAADALAAAGHSERALQLRALRPVTDELAALELTRVATRHIDELRGPIYGRAQRLMVSVLCAAIAAWRGYPVPLRRHLIAVERRAARMTAHPALQEASA